MTSVQAKLKGWQPLTPRGAVALAGASLARLLLVEFVFAVLIAASVVWFVPTAWYPAIQAAIQQLPARGEIRSGGLAWPGDSPQVLAGNHFLALIVDLNHAGEARPPADIQVEFGKDGVRVFSLFGYTEWQYPQGWIIPCNRPELEPWWGAWAPPILWISVGITLMGLMAAWTLLATVYFLPVWLVGFFGNRDLNFGASWKLAGAALMPGALLLAAAVVGYGSGVLDLVKFFITVGAHLVAGFVCALAGPCFAPRLSFVAAAKGNPFAVPASGKPDNDLPTPGG